MSEIERQRENRLRMVEDHIGRHLEESARSGELRSAPGFGKPMDLGDGYQETPEELRMGYKILKDAGYVPPEVELMQDINRLARELESIPPGAGRVEAQAKLSHLRQKLALQMERLRPS